MRTLFMSWRHQFMSITLSALVVLIAGVVALAQERDRPRFKDDQNAQRAEQRAKTADATNARLVALVRAPDARVVLKKGVQNVTRIDTGVYCIKPQAATGLDPRTAIAVVSVEYFYSLLNEVQVQWARRQNGCGADRFGVYTLADQNLNGVYNLSNAVGFVIYVP